MSSPSVAPIAAASFTAKIVDGQRAHVEIYRADGKPTSTNLRAELAKQLPNGAACVLLSKDNSLLVTGGFNRQVNVWTMHDACRCAVHIATLDGHGKDKVSRFSCLAVVPNERHSPAAGALHRLLATGSDDQTVNLWDLSRPVGKKFIGKLSGEGSVRSMFFSCCGPTLSNTAIKDLMLATVGADRRVLVWRIARDVANVASIGIGKWTVDTQPLAQISVDTSHDVVAVEFCLELRIVCVLTAAELLAYRLPGQRSESTAPIALSLAGSLPFFRSASPWSYATATAFRKHCYKHMSNITSPRPTKSLPSVQEGSTLRTQPSIPAARDVSHSACTTADADPMPHVQPVLTDTVLASVFSEKWTTEESERIAIVQTKLLAHSGFVGVGHADLGSVCIRDDEGFLTITRLKCFTNSTLEPQLRTVVCADMLKRASTVSEPSRTPLEQVAAQLVQPFFSFRGQSCEEAASALAATLLPPEAADGGLAMWFGFRPVTPGCGDDVPVQHEPAVDEWWASALQCPQSVVVFPQLMAAMNVALRLQDLDVSTEGLPIPLLMVAGVCRRREFVMDGPPSVPLGTSADVAVAAFETKTRGQQHSLRLCGPTLEGAAFAFVAPPSATCVPVGIVWVKRYAHPAKPAGPLASVWKIRGSALNHQTLGALQKNMTVACGTIGVHRSSLCPFIRYDSTWRIEDSSLLPLQQIRDAFDCLTKTYVPSKADEKQCSLTDTAQIAAQLLRPFFSEFAGSSVSKLAADLLTPQLSSSRSLSLWVGFRPYFAAGTCLNSSVVMEPVPAVDKQWSVAFHRPNGIVAYPQLMVAIEMSLRAKCPRDSRGRIPVLMVAGAFKRRHFVFGSTPIKRAATATDLVVAAFEPNSSHPMPLCGPAVPGAAFAFVAPCDKCVALTVLWVREASSSTQQEKRSPEATDVGRSLLSNAAAENRYVQSRCSESVPPLESVLSQVRDEECPFSRRAVPPPTAEQHTFSPQSPYDRIRHSHTDDTVSLRAPITEPSEWSSPPSFKEPGISWKFTLTQVFLGLLLAVAVLRLL